eukprot:comp21715_c0_seq1/m.30683 comp21715_c0_seq1/g.30683  ORF comp21715_c0_seq1/g.30683 comp21715_c0_seq1/m.30683 type:complete len:333 (-) comp21715_c0_seq1:390-1388(-)
MAVKLESDTTSQQPEQMEEQISWLLGKSEPATFVGDYHTDAKIRPPFDYATLCAKAIMSCPEGRGTLSELYTYISGSFPYYAQAWTCWQNSIRHTLSHHKCFVRVEGPSRDGRNKHCRFWTICEESRSCFTEEGIYINNKSRRRMRSVNGVPREQDATAPAKRRPAKRSASLPETTLAIERPATVYRSPSLPNTLPPLPAQNVPLFSSFQMLSDLPTLNQVPAQHMHFRAPKPEPHYYPVKMARPVMKSPPTPPVQLSPLSVSSVSPMSSPMSYMQSPVYMSSPLEVELPQTWMEPLDQPLFDDYLTTSAFVGLRTDLDWNSLTASLLGLEA